MKPNYIILADDEDVTAAIKERFISLTLSDNNGFENDTLKIKIDDTNNKVKTPRKGVELTVWLGYGNDLYNKGSFEVDEVTSSGMPETIEIVAKGSNINKSLKKPRQHTYNDITLGGILNTVATRNGMRAEISDFLSGINIEQFNQVNETDLNLLTRLSTYYDAKFKAASGVLLFFLKDDFKTTSSEALEPVIINKRECSDWSFKETDRSKYDAVIAKWRDTDAAETKEVQVGSGDDIFSISTLFASAEEANNRANTKYNDLMRARAKGSLSTVGNPKIASEFEIKLVGFRYKEFKCESCTHTLDRNGYTTQVQLINKK